MESKESSKRSRLVKSLNQSYLGKWAFIGLLIGIVAGLGATAFYFLIQFVTNFMLGGITGFYPPNPAGEPSSPISTNPHFLLIPISTALGGIIAGLIVFTFAPEAEGHGTDAAIEAFHQKGGIIRRRIPIVKTIASAFTIGSGGSAGREGPTAQIAAGFGSIIGQVFGLSVRDRRIAVAAGIGAGIGAIFKSPFAGAILGAEILYRGPDIEADALVPSFIAAPVGYVIFGLFTGFTPIFGSSIQYDFTKPLNLVFYAILGLVCAGVGRLYTTSFYGVKKFFMKLRIPGFVRPMLGAAIAGVIGIFFPEVLGLGYGFLQFAVDGNFSAIFVNYVTLPTILILLALVFLKIFATSLTVGSGGSGGVFAPALFIGGFLGAVLWIVIDSFDPSLIPIPFPLVIVGMMALFAGIGRAPIATILMVSEMTGNLTLLAPSMIAVVISYYLTGSKYTIYQSQVETKADSPAHRREYNVPLMTKISVESAMVKNVESLNENDSAARAIQVMVEKKIKGLPVLSSSRKVVGMVTMSDVGRVPKDLLGSTSVSEIMTKNVVSIGGQESLYEALKKMTANGIGRLPVIENGRLTGIITRTDLFTAYDKAVTEK